MFKEKTKSSKIKLVVAGGVAATKSIRKNLTNLSKELGFETIYPDAKLCGDNAAMIVWAGIKRFKKKLIDDYKIQARPDGNLIAMLLT